MGVRITGGPPNKNIYTKFAKGNVTAGAAGFSITGLSFTPTMVAYYSKSLTANIRGAIGIARKAADIYNQQPNTQGGIGFMNGTSATGLNAQNATWTANGVSVISLYDSTDVEWWAFG